MLHPPGFTAWTRIPQMTGICLYPPFPGISWESKSHPASIQRRTGRPHVPTATPRQPQAPHLAQEPARGHPGVTEGVDTWQWSAWRLTCQIVELCVRGAGQGFLQLWVQGHLFFLPRFHRLFFGDKDSPLNQKRKHGCCDSPGGWLMPMHS